MIIEKYDVSTHVIRKQHKERVCASSSKMTEILFYNIAVLFLLCITDNDLLWVWLGWGLYQS